MLASSPAAEAVSSRCPWPLAAIRGASARARCTWASTCTANDRVQSSSPPQVPAQRHPGVGAPQVDRPELLLDPVHQPGHGRRVGHVQGHGQRRRAGEPGRHPSGPGPVEVGHDHRSRPLGREPLGQGPADPPRPAGDDRHRAL
jgi:hypothetical protein